jgi:hypothetical protein
VKKTPAQKIRDYFKSPKWIKFVKKRKESEKDGRLR